MIIRGDQILLNQCRWPSGSIYYDLPGGGQQMYEPMEDAVAREVYEETGYRIRVVRLAAIAENIYEGSAVRAREPEYCHIIYHIFIAELLDQTPAAVAEMDYQQEATVWAPLSEVANLPIVPQALQNRIIEAIHSDGALWLGTQTIAYCEI
jgi:8-oxo-dGTP diphosphatase